MKTLIEKFKARLSELSYQMKIHEEEVEGSHTREYAEMRGRWLELNEAVNEIQGLHVLERDKSITDFAEWLQSEGFPVPERKVQEYLKYGGEGQDAKQHASSSLPSDDRILAEAIQAARKFDTEAGLLPSNNDIKMFCLGAKWMRDLVNGNDS